MPRVATSATTGRGGFDRPAPGRSQAGVAEPSGYRCTPAHASIYTALAASLLCIHALGGMLASDAATTVGCFALLLVGLPHGTLDLELIKRERGRVSMPVLLLLYLGFAAAMYALWRVAPLAALIAFLLTAALHFAEDWREVDQSFLAQGAAVALLTAPALAHRSELAALFVALSGVERAGSIADMMLMISPIGLAVGGVATLRLWTTGRRPQAAVTAATLAAMTALPPVTGFALFFCVHHSPRHLREAWGDLARAGPRRYSPIVGALTLAALGIAAGLFALETRADLAARVVAASFMTLSILTVPHMAAPAILSRWRDF
ncbi:Brp/Blh family beta-carotene 15,15'-dioxygenase [uncultured Sphingomonas sp.]|uniref:Brp/Blh family beta-carotene 15,15'-dioxygenase n=1 Tax=uncultured Sphingomonas sp. TaxID=158754 RepID=UPI0035CA2205